MFLHKPFPTSGALITCIVFSLLLGCSGEKKLSDHYSSNMEKVYLFYSMFMENHGMKGPKDEAELKEYLTNDATAVFILKRIDVTPENIDQFFISERDGEPFTIKFDVKGVADHAIVFEKTGVDGKRLVGFGKPRELESDEYEGHLAGDIKPEGMTLAEEAGGDSEEE